MVITKTPPVILEFAYFLTYISMICFDFPARHCFCFVCSASIVQYSITTILDTLSFDDVFVLILHTVKYSLEIDQWGCHSNRTQSNYPYLKLKFNQW